MVYSVQKFWGFSRDFFKSPLKQGLERSSNISEQIKKARQRRAFCVYYQSGLSAPNPDTRNFSGKVSWNFKSFAKNEIWVRWEVLVSTLSFKKGKKSRLEGIFLYLRIFSRICFFGGQIFFENKNVSYGVRFIF